MPTVEMWEARRPEASRALPSPSPAQPVTSVLWRGPLREKSTPTAQAAEGQLPLASSDQLERMRGT